MVRIIDGNIFDSDANFIVNYCNNMGVIDSEMSYQVSDAFPHVEKEYMRYIKYYSNNNSKLSGSVQYVPTEIWAMNMVDTIKNNNVEAYDTNYQYVVNVFCQEVSDYKVHTDLNAMKKAFADIRDKASKIGATVAIPYETEGYRNDTSWNNLYNIVKKVFEQSDVNAEIWRYDLM